MEIKRIWEKSEDYFADGALIYVHNGQHAGRIIQLQHSHDGKCQKNVWNIIERDLNVEPLHFIWMAI